MNRIFYNTIDDFAGVTYDYIMVIIQEGRKDRVVVDIYETYQVLWGPKRFLFKPSTAAATHSEINNKIWAIFSYVCSQI